ncbi:MAG TPA: hypothetical protein PK957_00095 [Candidatus Dojkabacteria bacterium]|nr:hypothetical protein [Candidatus Dojkabacteria bacterium]HQF36179.1 hypothetical protein [Candidatus Dojkabacteria bacterium]
MNINKIENLFAGLSIQVPGSNKDPDSILRDVLSVVMALVGVVVIGMFLYGGFLLITSAGDTNKVQKGTQTIVTAVVGLVITLLAVLIINFIARLLGVDLWKSLNQFS